MKLGYKNASIKNLLIQIFVLFTITFLTFVTQARNGTLNKVPRVNVLLVNPSVESDPFWQKTEALTSEAAKQLNINYSVIHNSNNKISQFAKVKQFIKKSPHPIDYIVLSNYSGNAKAMMDYLAKQQIKVITLEQTISDNEHDLIGSPREKYIHWIGEISFSNQQAGYDLANYLLNSATLAGNKGVIAGISGTTSAETFLRNKGLTNASRTKNATLTNIVHAGWSEKMAYDHTIRLLTRNPDINTIWSASDTMALAAMKASEILGRKPGQDIFIGGFDWTNNAIEQIKNRKISASVGGHFVKGAIAMLIIHSEENYFKHHEDKQPITHSFNLSLITQENAMHYENVLKPERFSEIDFKKIALSYINNKQSSQLNLLTLFEKATN